ncbi:unnamed protein product, partial [Phaeothamnion confervicola]
SKILKDPGARRVGKRSILILRRRQMARLFRAIAFASGAAQVAADAGLLFKATFDEDVFATGSFKKSTQSDYAAQDVAVDSCSLEDFSTDTGLLLRKANQRYGIGAMFEEPLVVKSEDLVVQYEVQLRNRLPCGGAYVKLLRDEPGVSIEGLNGDTPYTIMFGPDKCGTGTNKVHFILQHQNPVTGEWEEKHLKNAPRIKDDTQFHLYTLVIRADNSFEILIDAESAAKGSLLDAMEPPVNPPKMIDDPNDSKPADWVDTPKIPDPAATKPADWDEDAPQRISDETARMPDGWLEDAPDLVPDPEATVPADWDEEEDGVWEPPLVPNPACASAPGCGKWERPTIANPDFQGEWTAPLIDNPAYKGPWSPRQIENPGFFEDVQPADVAKIAGVAVEIWTTVGGIWIDNLVIGTDADTALAFAEATWRPKHAKQAEKESVEKEAARLKKEADWKESQLSGGWRGVAGIKLAEALEYGKANPIAAVATAVSALVGLVMLCSGLSRRRRRRQQPGAAVAAAAGESTGAEER